MLAFYVAPTGMAVEKWIGTHKRHESLIMKPFNVAGRSIPRETRAEASKTNLISTNGFGNGIALVSAGGSST